MSQPLTPEFGPGAARKRAAQAVGAIFRAARLAHRLSQDQLAEASDSALGPV
jgi:hypothetical protein